MRKLIASAALGATILLASPPVTLAVPFEAKPPHLRNDTLMFDTTFVDAVADARLREIVRDIEAGNSDIAKRKLVFFLRAAPGNVQAIEILGTLLMNEGEQLQAEKLMRQGIETAPDQVSLRIRYAVALLNQQKFAEAAPHLQFAVEKEPDNVLALTNYGWLMAVLDRNRQALPIYERLRGKEFEGKVARLDLFVGLTVLYYRLNLHDRTIALLAPEFAQATKTHLNNRLFLNLFDAYLSTGDLTKAAETLDRLTPLVPAEHPGTTLARARLLAAQGKHEKATAVLTAALRTYPKSATDIHLTGARIELDRKYYRRARDAFATAATSAPSSDRNAILSEMSKAFAAAKRSGDVTATLQRFATSNGGDLSVALLLAENLVQSQRTAEALALVDRLAAANPDLAQAHLLKSILLRSEKKIPEARAAMRRSVTANPANPGAWHMLADLAHDMDGDAAMVAVLKEGLAKNPTDPRLLFGVGSLSYSQGDVAVSADIYKRMVAQFPNDPSALSGAALASLDLGENPEVARPLLIRAQQHAPNVPAIADTWGWMLHKSGESAAAIELLRRVEKAIPQDGGVQYHLGIAYLESGSSGEGRGALRKALALGVPLHYREDIIKRLAAK